mgnify:CR=1 FL=1
MAKIYWEYWFFKYEFISKHQHTTYRVRKCCDWRYTRALGVGQKTCRYPQRIGASHKIIDATSTIIPEKAWTN